MEKALDEMSLKEGDTIRLVLPGNNDQKTPIIAARQIKFIQDYSNQKDLKLNIEILVMGQGGHATTATFPQIGELNGGFSGTPEAVSLGKTLFDDLTHFGLQPIYVNEFSQAEVFGEYGHKYIKFKFAETSTNTGENVQEAIDAYEKDKQPPCHLLVCSSSSTRQALTFAQQYSEDRKIPSAKKHYQSITAIPMRRSREFIQKGLSEHQAVTEMYAGLRERAQFYAYSYNLKTPYIPAGPIDGVDLRDLYIAYDKLSGTNSLEESKKKPIGELSRFFNTQFQALEASIPWSKDEKLQLMATKSSLDETGRRYKSNKAFAEFVKRYEDLSQRTDLSEADKKKIKSYGKVFKKFKKTQDAHVKSACYQLLIRSVTELKNIKARAPDPYAKYYPGVRPISCHRLLELNAGTS